MKIRSGFVSNSSTTSFICSVCGEVETGQDACAEDFGMSECDRGHIWHNECLTKLLGKEIRTSEDSDYNLVPEDNCPYCNLHLLDRDDELTAYRDLSGITHEQLLEKIRKKYGNWLKFHEDTIRRNIRRAPEINNTPDYEL